METESPRSKVEAIYELREAVEAKAHAEHALDAQASPAARSTLLDAQLEVEAKTQDAIDACHECGHDTADDHVHTAPRVAGRVDNVVHVNFGSTTGAA